VRGWVDLDVGHPDGGAVVAVDAPQLRGDPGEQLAEPERLRDVVVGAGAEAQHDVHLLVARRQHHDRQRRRAAPQPPADLDAVDVGEAQVEQHEVGPRRVDGDQRVGTAGTAHDVVAALAQHQLQRSADRLVVLDDQQVRRRHPPDATDRPCGCPARFARRLPELAYARRAHVVHDRPSIPPGAASRGSQREDPVDDQR
jgi:hypothetical protein